MSENAPTQVAEAIAAVNKRIAMLYFEAFSDAAGAAVLEHLREHVFQPRRTPREGMTMEETALFTLGEQSQFHAIQQNINNGRKLRENG